MIGEKVQDAITREIFTIEDDGNKLRLVGDKGSIKRLYSNTFRSKIADGTYIVQSSICMGCISLSKDIISGHSFCEVYAELCDFRSEACHYHSETLDDLEDKLYEEELAGHAAGEDRMYGDW